MCTHYLRLYDLILKDMKRFFDLALAFLYPIPFSSTPSIGEAALRKVLPDEIQSLDDDYEMAAALLLACRGPAKVRLSTARFLNALNSFQAEYAVVQYYASKIRTAFEQITQHLAHRGKDDGRKWAFKNHIFSACTRACDTRLDMLLRLPQRFEGTRFFNV